MALIWTTIWIESSIIKYAVFGDIKVSIRSATTIFYILKAEFCSRSTYFWDLSASWQGASRNLQHPKEMILAKLEEWHKRGFFGPLFALKRAKLFRISWMRASSSWKPLSRLHQWFHGHVQSLLYLRPKIRIACIWRALCTHRPSLKRVLREKHHTDAGKIVEAAFQEVKPGPGKDYMCHPQSRHFLKTPRWISLLLIKASG